MVSPGTHLAKNHESQSRAIESHNSKTRIPGSLCNHRVNLLRHTPKLGITVYWFKNNNILLVLSSTTKTERNMPQEKPQKYSSKTSSDWSIDLCVLRDAYQKLFCIFEVTKSLVMGESSFQCSGCFYTDSPVINKVIITKITTEHRKRSLNLRWCCYHLFLRN